MPQYFRNSHKSKSYIYIYMYIHLKYFTQSVSILRNVGSVSASIFFVYYNWDEDESSQAKFY